MALILHRLGVAPEVASSSTPTQKDHHRKRLHKAPPKRNSTKSLYSCKEILDVVRAQSCLILYDHNENLSVVELQDEDSHEITEPRPHIGFLLEQPPPKSEDSISNYSTNEMESQPSRRTRAKTPVFAVGQLERNSKVPPTDRAQTLSEQYQALLPPRPITPYIEMEHPKLTSKLRKIKCQLSLRDLIKEHSKRIHSVAYSDADTLVGSESPISPLSLRDGEFEKAKLPIIKPVAHEPAFSDSVAALDDDIGLKICVDLLTNELATALFRHHPAEREDRASGLQILLMIEAYETVQQHVRQQLCDPHVKEETKDHVKSADRILKYWLKVLYAVYDQSQERKFEKKVGEDQSPHHSSPEEVTH
jgi:hypothetical protein